ncbi:hypothetical protein AB0O34_27025 [Sphaerisporangium sp. NPDC088356]|uniref:hypothetical protein n=1 Tax=Sphaerisporangium sp. NPDC088356 TaxID=3154871 RepID=UPI003446AF81
MADRCGYCPYVKREGFVRNWRLSGQRRERRSREVVRGTGAGKEPAMEGLTIAILVIMLFSGIMFSWRNRQGSDALESVAGDFPLTPESAAEIAAEAGLTTCERNAGRTARVVRTADRLRFEFACRAGVMEFEIRELPGSAGCRVTGHAGDVALIRLPEVGGLGASSTNVLYMKVGMPRNPARLLRRRERVFRALSRAALDDGRRRADVEEVSRR